MNAVLRTIRILVVTALINQISCQDGYSDRDIFRFQQQMAGEGQMGQITGYNANVLQRDQNQAMTSVSAQFHMTDEADKNEDYNRADRSGRTRKVYRIKNPFQRQGEENQQEANTNQDADAGASNQYAAMQYSLPPEEFLQQMRENQYYQQVSTPAPGIGYTATPQPYQYSTIAASGYDNQQQNHIPQLEPKLSNPQSYRSYQYGPSPYGDDTAQSTPAPHLYISTPLPNNQQFVGTAPNYISSSSPMYLSSPPNMQQYLSSPNSIVQTGTPDYNKVTSTLGSNSLSYDNNDANKKIQIDHYDNSANGIRNPYNLQQQYQNEYPSSTMSPTSTPYPDPMREWPNSMNNGNTAPKSIQDNIQYQKYPYNRKQQENRYDQNPDTTNSETHRIGDVAAANNLYFNYAPPEYQSFPNFRTRARDGEHETTQKPEYYSHGEYGWRLNNDNKNLETQASSYPSYPRFQTMSPQNDGVAVSQMNFHMETGKHTYNPISKSSTESSDAQEFAKAAAKAHENMKQRQQFYENFYNNYNTNNAANTQSPNNYYYEKQGSKYLTINNNPYIYGTAQPDLITASPYYLATSKEIEDKPKRPFDHDKAMKNIVPIDVSNVVNSENQQKIQSAIDTNNKLAFQNYKDQVEQNMKQNYKAITDAYYQDKNAAYGFNIKNKPEETGDTLRFYDSNGHLYTKQSSQDQVYNPLNQYSDKRLNEGVPQPGGFMQNQPSNSYQDSIQSSANIQQQQYQPRLQNTNQNQHLTDISSILKLNDIPYRIMQGLPQDAFSGRQQGHSYEHLGLPTPLPMRLNQNVGSHNIDAASDILNKLILNKQPPLNLRPEVDPQTGNLLSTINGIKVANPFNVDLKLVADMLKGKPAIEDSQMISLRDQFTKPSPIKLELSHLQQLLSAKPTIAQLNDGLAAYSSPYLDIYGGRYPYQGVKYSRSQEEEESLIPIADASNTHPIGAVVEQDDVINIQDINNAAELPELEEEIGVQNLSDDRPKKGPFGPEKHRLPERHKHPNSLPPGRQHHPRKYPKHESFKPHGLIKPPSSHFQRGRVPLKLEKSPNGRRRRVKRPRSRVMRSEPLFEAENEENLEPEIPILLRPPPPTAEAKSDHTPEEQTS